MKTEVTIVEVLINVTNSLKKMI